MKAFFKILFRFYRFSSWIKYKLPRRFTPAGLGLLGASGLCLLMLPDTDNNLTYQAFSFLLCLVLIPVAFCFYFKTQLAVDRTLPRFGTVGEKLRYPVRLTNLSRKPQAALTLLEDLRDSRPSFEEWYGVQVADQKQIRSFRFTNRRRTSPFHIAKVKEGQLPIVPAGRDAETQVELIPLRRGVLRFQGVTLGRPDPLGIARAFVKFPLAQSMIVLPKRYVLPPIALPGSMKYQQGGVALAANVGQSEEFVSLRDYRNGDPLRHIHWRSWAKAGKPVVKEFEDEFFVRHALVLDTFTDHPCSDEFEEAVSLAASFACTIATQESLLDLLFVGLESFCFTAGRGLGGVDQMLEVLASVRPCAGTPFERLEPLVLNHVKLVSGVLCVLLDWDSARQEFVRKLDALGVSTLVLVVANPAKAKAIARESSPARKNWHLLETGRIQEDLAKLG